MITAIVALITLIAGGGLGYYAHSQLSKMKLTHAKKEAADILKQANMEAQMIHKEATVQARDELINARKEYEEETRKARQEWRAKEERITQKETNLDRKVTMLDRKEERLEKLQEELNQRNAECQQKEKELQHLCDKEKETLLEMASLSEEDARRMLMENIEQEMRTEAAAKLRHIEDETKQSAEQTAREIITTAIQRYAADQASEVTTSTVHLPSDEMKGRIIGKEGRNIRSLESCLGVDILIDDTPEVVVISGFDPLRREIARIALERLISDGRIHPARIEEVVSKVRDEIEETMRKEGEKAIYDLGLTKVAPEIVRTVGRLKFRHSFSQNVLQHSLEMAHLMGMMAEELGLDAAIAKRVGLFHDLGKALDHAIEGSHALIGADLLRKHGEQPVVYNAVAAHHGDVEPESLYATLATAADAITASRPGARSETTEIYLKRLHDLEEIATGFRGVEKCYAIQAGREIRVIVEPSKIDDNDALQMARNIAKQIESTMKYPGQIKVTVVRETRCIEYAK